VPAGAPERGMARGFESKSVADQQEAAFNPRPSGERIQSAQRRSLELARIDVVRRLAVATSEPLKRMLEQALTDIDARIGAFDKAPPQE
jgi:hypothetical protein